MRARIDRYLLNVAGPRRTPALNRHLAYLLALVAGVLNSVGFVAVAVYTSHMTGLTAMVADHLVLGDLRLVAVGVLAVLAFTAGAGEFLECDTAFRLGADVDDGHVLLDRDDATLDDGPFGDLVLEEALLEEGGEIIAARATPQSGTCGHSLS